MRCLWIRGFFAALVFGHFVLFSGPQAAGQALAQGSEARPKRADHADLIRQHEEFLLWRQGIPDYEKRLYDRVKTVNKRVVQTRGILIISSIVIIVVLVVGMTLIYRRVDTAMRSIEGLAKGDSSREIDSGH